MKIELPQHKHDVEAAELIVAVGMPEVEPLLGGILEWLQDYNWPVASILAPLFDQMGEEVVPHIRLILDSDDDLWKYWMVVIVLPKLSRGAQELLRPDIERIANHPSDGEVKEEVQLEAVDYLSNNVT